MQQKQTIFANGIFLKDRHPNCPEYVLATIGIKVDEFIQCLQQHNSNGWVTLVLKRSQGGKKYFEIDTWQPKNSPRAQEQAQGYQQPPRPVVAPPATGQYAVAPPSVRDQYAQPPQQFQPQPPSQSAGYQQSFDYSNGGQDDCPF